MSVEIACTCDGLPAHSHIYRFQPTPDGIAPQRVDTGEVRVWVDWRAVAHALATGPASPVLGKDE